MANFARAALALSLLTKSATAQTSFVCGTDYNDASKNCTDNPTCFTGGGCPAGKTCFSVPSCLSSVTPKPTPKPTPNPTVRPTNEEGYVCGSDWTDATSNCLTNPKCPSGDGCADGHICFSLPASACPAPVPVVPSVCGINYKDATSCRGNPGCPNGDGCPKGMICYSNIDCPELTTNDSPIDDLANTATMVCGKTYNDAYKNFCVNEQCHSGQGCAIGYCFAYLPYTDCSAGAPLVGDATESSATEDSIEPGE